jgi:polyisoprenoid-binding protein YceI
MSTTWNIDASHTVLEFAVKHMAISTVKGRFKALSGTIQTNDAGVLENVNVVIDATSIDTNDAQRDGHLKSPDFFNTEKHPTLEFKSTNVQSKGGHEYSVTGDLTMNGVTKAVTLEVETVAPIKDPWGLQRSAASGNGKISRKEWDLTWNQALEFGGFLVSDDVKITLEVQAIVPPAA